MAASSSAQALRRWPAWHAGWRAARWLSDWQAAGDFGDKKSAAGAALELHESGTKCLSLIIRYLVITEVGDPSLPQVRAAGAP